MNEAIIKTKGRIGNGAVISSGPGVGPRGSIRGTLGALVGTQEVGSASADVHW